MSRLRGVVKGAVKLTALVLVFSCILAFFLRWRAATRGSVPPRRRAVFSLAPLHRQLISTALSDDPSAQPAPSPASPDADGRKSALGQTGQRAHASQQALHPSISTSEDVTAGGAHAPVPGGADEQAHLSSLLPAAAPVIELSVSGASLDSRNTGASIAQPSSDPAAAPGAARNAAGAAPMLAAAQASAPLAYQPRRRQRTEQDALARRRQHVGAAVPVVTLAASPAYEVLERVTPQERLRAFEWLFGPKLPQPPPELTPVAAAAVAHDPACAAFYRRDPLGPRTVAVVGNGPLSEADARRVDGMDLVMRFNRLNNW